MTTQLRIYTVKDGLIDEWARRWLQEVLPLRLAMGFTLDGAWIDRAQNQFIWLISYDGPGTFAEANSRYWASPEREALMLDPDDYLIATEERTVEAV